jgi:hypothetical protein
MQGNFNAPSLTAEAFRPIEANQTQRRTGFPAKAIADTGEFFQIQMMLFQRFCRIKSGYACLKLSFC